LQRVAVCCSVLQCVAVCCSVLQCVAVCCSVLQCVAVYFLDRHHQIVRRHLPFYFSATHRNTLQQYNTTHCNKLQHTYLLQRQHQIVRCQYTATHCNNTTQHHPANTLQQTATNLNTRTSCSDSIKSCAVTCVSSFCCFASAPSAPPSIATSDAIFAFLSDSIFALFSAPRASAKEAADLTTVCCSVLQRVAAVVHSQMSICKYLFYIKHFVWYISSHVNI